MKGEAINNADATATPAAILNSNQLRSEGVSGGRRTTVGTAVTGAVYENQCKK
jgi:hypothetical protein